MNLSGSNFIPFSYGHAPEKFPMCDFSMNSTSITQKPAALW